MPLVLAGEARPRATSAGGWRFAAPSAVARPFESREPRSAWMEGASDSVNGMRPSPKRVVHADWSVAPKKRWAARADRLPHGAYAVGTPKLVTPAELLDIARGTSTLIGFDFPIGLPASYAARVGATSFSELVPLLGSGDWSSFFEVAHSRSEISLQRPFYPHRVGGTKREHLVEGLGLRSADDLFRACEVAEGRRACPLFWTLGGNQVGKGALSGWREVLQPALATGAVDLWPFDGAFDDLLARGRTVIVETYPGDVYPYVGATLPKTASGSGKRSQASRAASAQGIAAWARRANLVLSAELELELRDGFGRSDDGEDRFDAIVGLLGMLAVVLGERPVGIPASDEMSRVEGWILGRASASDDVLTGA